MVSGIYPSTCPVCSNASDNIACAPICSRCWHSIGRYTGPACQVCAAPLVSEYSTMCRKCMTHRPSFSSVIFFSVYSGALKEAIHILKFSGIRRLARPMAGFLAELDVPEADGIIPVPLTKKALSQRGFNQTLLLARQVSRRAGIPLHMDTLFKNKDTRPQIGLGARDRISNVRGAFEAKGSINGMRLILLDDVMTTGATADECSKTLIAAGAREVVVVALARAMTD